ncbi:MAG: hypothetical protein H6819_06035 [Phycisphaerales bacterium]|nr:hypothetical protein [Phycisphaerales bacterium]MCB9858619.1 hypothetical protein [Phycisphaerales bacterium]
MTTLHPHVIEIIRSLEYDPNAQRTFEWLSGALVWSDEGMVLLDEAAETTMLVCTVIKRLAAYRSSLILGEPRADLADVWNEVKKAAPNWPGFRPERQHPSLREPLERHLAQVIPAFDRMDRIFERATRMAASRARRKRRRRIKITTAIIVAAIAVGWFVYEIMSD